MLGLAEQVGGAHFAVDAVIGDDQRLGRPGQKIDADAAEQLPLGFGDVGIARADDHVDRRDGLGAERHGGDRLHATEHENLVGAAEMHRRHDRRMRPAVKRRRAGDDVLHAGDARGDDRHMRRRHHRIAPARHVAADRIRPEYSCGRARRPAASRPRRRAALPSALCAKLRTCAWANLMSSRSRCLTWPMARSTSAGVSLNEAGDQLSNFCDRSRTAASLRASMSARICSTVSRTLASASLIALASIPRLRCLAMV